MTAPTLAQVLAAGDDGGGHNATGIASLAATNIVATNVTTGTIEATAGNVTVTQGDVNLLADGFGLRSYTSSGQSIAIVANADTLNIGDTQGWNAIAFRLPPGNLLTINQDGSVVTQYNTLDDGSGDGYFAGTLTTTNTTLDDGAGNATFNGEVQATAFNSSSYNTISNLPAIQLGQYTSVTSPHEGMISYDNTLHKLKVYTNSGWQTVTSA